MKTVGYARVSTTGQSLESQLESLKHCDIIFQEKISGATLARPELDRLMQYLRVGDVLEVTKLDRLARSTKDLLETVEDLNKRQCTLRIQNINLDTSTPTGKLMLTMLGAIAEFERGLMLERQAEGIARAKQSGKYKGRVPTANEKVMRVFTMLEQKATRVDIALEVGVSLATVNRLAVKWKGCNVLPA